MKTFLTMILLVTTFTVNAKQNEDMPELHLIKTITLESPYSCNGSYEKSAVFLTDYSIRRNSPDLLYNGACGSKNYIDASTAGDDFSLISDLGNVDIRKVSASKAFNFKRTVGQDNTFKETAVLIKGHVYAVLTSKSDIRSLVIYKLIEHTPGKSATFEYAVKAYSIQSTEIESPYFSWGERNYR
jgi:hypothetical protein